MKNIWMLAKANLRKSKSQTVSVLLIVIVAALMLNVGLVLFTGVGSFFDERAKELNAPSFVTILPASEPFDAQLAYIENFEGVSQVELQSALVGMGSFLLDDLELSGNIIIAPQTAYQQMNPPSLIGEYLPLSYNGIYIPHFLFLRGGFEIGDSFVVELSGENMQFYVAGSNEEIMFGSDFNNLWRVHISQERFEGLLPQFEANESVLISAQTDNDGRSLSINFGTEFDAITLSYGGVSNNRTFISVIAASMMVFFAAILLIVSIIVIRFRIANDIEEYMVNIGIQKAVGYKSRQIILSIVMQFGLIAFIGGLFGIGFAQLVLPLAAGIIEPQLGLVWNPAFEIAAMLVTVGLLVALILLFSFMASRRIKKLHPLIALRGGITTHSFRRNPAPLDKTKGSLNFLMAIKHLARKKGQAFMVGLIIAAVTFVSVEGLLISYNLSINTSSFMQFFGEIPDAFTFVGDAEEAERFREEIEPMPGVEMVLGLEFNRLMTDDISIAFTIVEDFNLIDPPSLIYGRLPVLENEVVLDTWALQELGKDVGDWVTISDSGAQKDFIVTGIIQEMDTNIGMIGYESMLYFRPDFQFVGFFIYFEQGVDIDEFIVDFAAMHPDLNVLLINALPLFETQMAAMGNIFVAVTVVILAVGSAVVIMVLYLIIKTITIRRRREFGIQKALGFTTAQLVKQMVLSLTPSIIIGTAVGAVAAYFLFNPVFLLMSRSMGMGIVQSSLLIPLSWVVVSAIAIVALAFVVALLVSWRLRKVSAYALVSE